MYTCMRRHLKQTFPKSNMTWSEMGKQNVQAKEVSYSRWQRLGNLKVKIGDSEFFFSGRNTFFT